MTVKNILAVFAIFLLGLSFTIGAKAQSIVSADLTSDQVLDSRAPVIDSFLGATVRLRLYPKLLGKAAATFFINGIVDIGEINLVQLHCASLVEEEHGTSGVSNSKPIATIKDFTFHGPIAMKSIPGINLFSGTLAVYACYGDITNLENVVLSGGLYADLHTDASPDYGEIGAILCIPSDRRAECNP